ncbi:MAG: hypothetical protein KDD58_06485 [Bdellovibrionales bacterium]|nr:hypothetical protein [Bdellovibrionales bacterium]MCB0390915.1 hypothetical protein [Bdellovibrionales bacterium]
MASLDLKLSDKILILVGIAMSITPIVIWNTPSLMNQLIKPKNLKTQNVIGFVNSTENDTRRRFSGSLSWYPLLTQEKLFENDTIFSGNDSNATIELNLDQQKLSLNLAANTLLTLSTENGVSHLNLELGSITSNLAQGQSLRLKVDGKEALLKANDNAQLVITNQGNKTTFSSETGSLNLTSNGNTQKFDKDKKVDYEAGKFKVKEVKFKSMTPSIGNQPLVLSNEEVIPFKWQASSKNLDNFKLEIAKSSDFKTKIASEPLSNQVQGSKIPTSGTYFWRITSADNKSQSKVHPFMLYKKEDFKILNPPTEHLESSNENKQGTIKFQWTTFPKTTNYEIEIAEDEQFSDIIDKKSVKETKKEDTLPEGLYFWRVKANTSLMSEPLLSTTNSFAVGKAGSFQEFVTALNTPPPPPEIPEVKPEPIKKEVKIVKTNPFTNSNLSLSPVKDINKKLRPNQKPKYISVPISWSKSLPNNKVLIKYADNEEFKDAKVIESEGNSDSITLTEPGTYFVKANYLSNKGQIISKPTSQIDFDYNIEYIIERPVLTQPSNNLKLVAFGQDKVSIYFEWKNISYADKYIFQISANSDFSRILSEQIIKENSYYLNEKMLQKQLYWRVKAIHKKLESKWSKFRVIYLNVTSDN